MVQWSSGVDLRVPESDCGQIQEVEFLRKQACGVDYFERARDNTIGSQLVNRLLPQIWQVCSQILYEGISFN